ncbi:MAG: cupin, partial [Pseudolabrys sp.]
KLSGSDDFLVIGAYPPDGTYNLCRGDNPAERNRALATIPKVPVPESDPVLGKAGPLPQLWRR